MSDVIHIQLLISSALDNDSVVMVLSCDIYLAATDVIRDWHQSYSVSCRKFFLRQTVAMTGVK